MLLNAMQNVMFSSNIKCIFIKLIFLVTFIQCAKSANILGVFPVAGKSLHILGNKLMKGLADAGHNVTVLSAYENKFPIINGSYKDVILTGFAEKYYAMIDGADFYSTPEHNHLSASHEIHELLMPFYREMFRIPNVAKFLKQDKKFDLIIIDCLWSDTILYLQEIYNCPAAIFVHTGGVFTRAYEMAGSPLPVSYVPHYWLLKESSNELTFSERLHNLLFYLYDAYHNYFILWPDHNKVLKSAFPNPTDVAKLYHTPSLILLGTHNSFRQSVPFAPNMVEIGGFHIDPPKTLPKYLQNLFDDAEHGFIYFSMGTHLKSNKFSNEKMQIFLNVFRKLKIKVIWKFDDEVLHGKPDNVLIRKWLPQTDILAHPNIKLFITHGGYGSTLETIYHGVPALAIPVFFDQFTNANRMVQKGFGLKLSYNDPNFSEETLYAMIEELIINPRYMKQAKYISQLFHDRPMKPLETMVYWAEYVIRHKGADHLKLSGAKLSWYKFYMVDVILFLLINIIAVTYFGIRIFKKIICNRNARKIKEN